jgi:lysine biosynthesis protein LysW
MATALCPDCGRKIVIGPKPKKGQRISCPHCDVDLEIVGVSPLELDWPEFEEEDNFDVDNWDDDDFDDWDEDDEDELEDLEEEEEDF